MKPMMIGLSPAAEATLRTIGPSTATAAPLDMVLVTPVVRAETATQRPRPSSAPIGSSNVRKDWATHWAAPVSFISTPREMAAA